MKAQVVSRKALAGAASRIGLAEHARIGRGLDRRSPFALGAREPLRGRRRRRLPRRRPRGRAALHPRHAPVRAGRRPASAGPAEAPSSASRRSASSDFDGRRRPTRSSSSGATTMPALSSSLRRRAASASRAPGVDREGGGALGRLEALLSLTRPSESRGPGASERRGTAARGSPATITPSKAGGRSTGIDDAPRVRLPGPRAQGARGTPARASPASSGRRPGRREGGSVRPRCHSPGRPGERPRAACERKGSVSVGNIWGAAPSPRHRPDRRGAGPPHPRGDLHRRRGRGLHPGPGRLRGPFHPVSRARELARGEAAADAASIRARLRARPRPSRAPPEQERPRVIAASVQALSSPSPGCATSRRNSSASRRATCST